MERKLRALQSELDNAVSLFYPLPHRDAIYIKAFANRADPDQAALVRAA